MSEHVITKGLDIPIKGRATGAPVVLEPPSTVAYSPTEFRGLTAKPAVREGDEVKRGTPLFFHKTCPEMVFRSPVAGRVQEIRRGRRRVITDLVVERTGDETESFAAATLPEIRRMSREDAVAAAVLDGDIGDRAPAGSFHHRAVVIGISRDADRVGTEQPVAVAVQAINVVVG